MTLAARERQFTWPDKLRFCEIGAVPKQEFEEVMLRQRISKMRIFGLTRKALIFALAAQISIVPGIGFANNSGAEPTPEKIQVKSIPFAPRSYNDRPTMHSILDSIRGGSVSSAAADSDPLARLTNLDQAALRPESFDPQEIEMRLPKFIAQMERAYPGLTYVFLGRDTALLASAVEAFYMSIGEAGRVVRLDVSSPTMHSMTSIADQVQLLASNGFTVKSREGLARPYILMDRTRNQSWSQSIVLREAAHATLMAAGLSVSQARRQVAVVNLSPTHESANPIPAKGSAIVKFVNTHAEMKGSSVFTADLGPLLDRQEWHESFRRELRKDEAGRVGGIPGQSFSSEHARIERDLRLLWAQVSRLAFHDAVRKEAKELGFEFTAPKEKNPDLLSVGEAVAAARDGSPISHLKVLEFFGNARLGEDAYREILGQMRLQSPEYQDRLARLLQQGSFEPVRVAAAEFLIAYDGLLQIETVSGFKKFAALFRDDSVSAGLEGRAVSLIERLVRLEISEGRGIVRPELFESIGQLLNDSRTEVDVEITKRLVQRWEAEMPHYDKRTVKQKVSPVVRGAVKTTMKEFAKPHSGTIPVMTLLGTLSGVAGLAIGGAVEASSMLVAGVSGAGALPSAIVLAAVVSECVKCVRNRELHQVDPANERLVKPMGHEGLRLMCPRALTPKK